MDFDPRDYDSRDEERFDGRKSSPHDFDHDDDPTCASNIATVTNLNL